MTDAGRLGLYVNTGSGYVFFPDYLMSESPTVANSLLSLSGIASKQSGTTFICEEHETDVLTFARSASYSELQDNRGRSGLVLTAAYQLTLAPDNHDETDKPALCMLSQLVFLVLGETLDSVYAAMSGEDDDAAAARAKIEKITEERREQLGALAAANRRQRDSKAQLAVTNDEAGHAPPPPPVLKAKTEVDSVIKRFAAAKPLGQQRESLLRRLADGPREMNFEVVFMILIVGLGLFALFLEGGAILDFVLSYLRHGRK